MKQINENDRLILIRAIAYAFACIDIYDSDYSLYRWGVESYNHSFLVNSKKQELTFEYPDRLISYCVVALYYGYVKSAEELEKIKQLTLSYAPLVLSDFESACDSAIQNIKTALNMMKGPREKWSGRFKQCSKDSIKQHITNGYEALSQIEKFKELYITLKKLDPPAFENVNSMARMIIEKENRIEAIENSNRNVAHAFRQLRALGFVA